MALLRRRFSKEFKLEIVKRSLGDERLSDIADEYKLHVNTISRWRREYLEAGQNSFPGEGNEQLNEDQKRIKRLEKELREAKLESEILKKAIRIFSKSDGRSTHL
jgi:transposase